MPITSALLPMAGQMAQGTGNALSGIVSGVTGFFQKRKANRLLAQNPYPTYNIPQEIMANQQIAQQMANEGLPSQQYEMARKNIDRQQTAAISAAQDRRGALGSISAIQQGSNDAYGNLDAQNAQARMQNERQLMGVNQDVAQYRDKAFDWNQKNRYLQNYNYAMGLLGAGNQNLIGGFDRLFAGLGGMASGGGMFGKGGSGTSQVPTATTVDQPNAYGTGGPIIF